MPKPASKPVIAVDIDDVLAANAQNFVAFSNKRWGTNLTPDDYTEHWAEMWKVDEEELESRRDVLFDEKVFIKHPHFTEAEPVLKELSSHYELIIVTSRRQIIAVDTIDWVNRHFKGIFSDVHFAGIWEQDNIDIISRINATKTDILKQVRADYLIDDQPKHCIAAAQAGIKAVLFGDYKWNQDTELSPNMARAKSWQEVLEYFTNER